MAEEEPPAPAEAEPADAPKDEGGAEEAKAEDAGPTVAEPATKNMSCFHFPDFIFMLAWFVSLFIMGYIAYAYGYYEVKEKFDEYEEKLDAYESGTSTSVPSDAIVGCINIAKIFGLCAAFALVASFVWVTILIIFGELLVALLFGVAICLFVVVGYMAGSFIPGAESTYIGFFFLILAGLTMLYYLWIKNRIHFAATCLAVGCKIVMHNPLLFVVALGMLLVTAAYAMLFVVAEVGIYFHLESLNASDQTETLAYFILLCFFFWSVQVFRNINVVTVSGAAAGWWFPSGALGETGTCTAFCRAVTYDLGAICFGSLLVAIIQTISAFFTYLAAKAESTGNKLLAMLMACIACLVDCIAQCAEYMNKYAYTYVGIYGYSFIYSGRKVMTLFGSELATVVNNDIIVEYLLLFGEIVVAACTCVFGVMFVERGPASWTEGLHPEARAVVGTVAFLVGYGIAGIMMGTLDAANKAVFVLYFENPHTLEQTHPTEHGQLKEAWEGLGKKERESDAAADEQGVLLPKDEEAK